MPIHWRLETIQIQIFSDRLFWKQANYFRQIISQFFNLLQPSESWKHDSMEL